MARHEHSDKLRACPACGRRVEAEQAKALGMRLYGDSDYLPDRVGFTDLDKVLERKGNVLVQELKPGSARLPTGQRLTLRTFVRLGADVWVVWEKTPKLVEVGVMDWQGEVQDVELMTMTEYESRVREWYDYADAHPRKFSRP